MTEGEFGLVDSFHIDNGELDGIPNNHCFVLGCEYTHVTQRCSDHPDDELNFTVNVQNKDRLQKHFDSRKREIAWKYPHDDIGEQWVYLDVFPVDSGWSGSMEADE